MDKKFFNKLLRECAETLRGYVDAASYKNMVLALLFLRALSSDAAHRNGQKACSSTCFHPPWRSPEDDSEDLTVPKTARWFEIKKSLEIREPAVCIDRALEDLEAENPKLFGAMPRRLQDLAIPRSKLAKLINIVSDLGEIHDLHHDDFDVIGEVYEYFLGEFAALEGQRGGEYYTPKSVVRLLVSCLSPISGVIYDPCCGSGGMFVQAAAPSEGQYLDPRINVIGQESNPGTWKLAMMNIALRGIKGSLGWSNADAFSEDMHPGVEADYVLANPPFNMSRWNTAGAETNNWLYGVPKASSANFAWIQKILNHLKPGGTAAVILSNGTLSSDPKGDGEIRKNLIEGNVVDAVISLPSQLFWNTQIAACVWLLSTSRTTGEASNGARTRPRADEVLFIDAERFGKMTDRTHKTLTSEDIALIGETFRSWRGDGPDEYRDRPGFSVAASTETIRYHRYMLVPGRYVGFSEKERINTDPKHIQELLQSKNLIVNRLLKQASNSMEMLEGSFRG